MQHVAIWRILTNIKVWQSIRANHRSHCRWLRIHHASCQSFCGQDTVWITHFVSSRISYEHSYHKLSPVWCLSNKKIFWEILLCISIHMPFKYEMQKWISSFSQLSPDSSHKFWNKFSGLGGLNRSHRGIIESPKIFRNWPYVSSKVPVPWSTL